jgi:hypothetical protein
MDLISTAKKPQQVADPACVFASRGGEKLADEVLRNEPNPLCFLPLQIAPICENVAAGVQFIDENWRARWRQTKGGRARKRRRHALSFAQILHECPLIKPRDQAQPSQAATANEAAKVQ